MGGWTAAKFMMYQVGVCPCLNVKSKTHTLYYVLPIPYYSYYGPEHSLFVSGKGSVCSSFGAGHFKSLDCKP